MDAYLVGLNILFVIDYSGLIFHKDLVTGETEWRQSMYELGAAQRLYPGSMVTLLLVSGKEAIEDLVERYCHPEQPQSDLSNLLRQAIQQMQEADPADYPTPAFRRMLDREPLVGRNDQSIWSF